MLDLIARVREVSLNRDLVVMVGGMLFRQHPEFASRSGSANVVFDGAHAVETAENLVEASRRLGQVKQP
jgi:methanogenic corrinoid protein MtbC1